MEMKRLQKKSQPPSSSAEEIDDNNIELIEEDTSTSSISNLLVTKSFLSIFYSVLGVFKMLCN